MPDLIAQGPQPSQRWRKSLVEQERLVIGRTTGTWATGWDAHISRQHVAVCWSQGKLRVTTFPQAHNPVYVRGTAVTDFDMVPGEHFVIGSTTFSLVDERARVSLHDSRPVTEQTFARHELRRQAFHRPDERIAALARLPDIIATSATVDELHSRLMNVLLTGLASASAVALVRAMAAEPIEVLQWDRRSLVQVEFAASAALVRQAVDSQESVVHFWPQGNNHLAATPGAEWAFCTPLTGRACAGQALYVTGVAMAPSATADPELLRDDLKFAELVATTYSRLGDAQAAERKLSGLAQFLSPPVLTALADRDWDEALAPREADLTVMFCDLRGFTRHAEQHAADLLALLARVSEALGIITQHMLAEGGVIGDFHGDAVMGFWGWPLPQADAAERAARAAQAIQRAFSQAALPASLTDFRVGVGLATGRAVAGKIGSADQVKITAFGPVVNLAARLESLTKQLHAPVLMDTATSTALAADNTQELSTRMLAPVLPSGFSRPVVAYELLSAEQQARFTPEYCRAWNMMVEQLRRGDWKEVQSFLAHVGPEDPPRGVLQVQLAALNYTCPATWPGGLVFAEK
jgi:adenylate cyclase